MNATMLVLSAGQICLSGKCQDDVECRVNSECPPLSSCSNFRCQETGRCGGMMIAQLVKYAMASPARIDDLECRDNVIVKMGGLLGE